MSPFELRSASWSSPQQGAVTSHMRCPKLPKVRAEQVLMQDRPFWENTRDFVILASSASFSLLTQILRPLENFGRTPTLRVVGISIVATILIVLFGTLFSMNSGMTPLPQADIVNPSKDALVPQVKSMVDDIYGDYVPR
mmetsp:Transcript_58862/g.97765  ORF Transcript_58862/g.97765 Transcript_58862/m.97765 type:complete len:139 (+) Transcript_58862:2-418(+)